MTELRLHVQSLDSFFEGARRAARRIDGGDMTPETPAIAFASIEQMFATLTPNRWTLLGKLREIGPSSIRALAAALSRDYRGVHSDVSKLLEVGLIEKDPSGKVHVPWTKITAELSLDAVA
jgi:predicted transcriptional regulator